MNEFKRVHQTLWQITFLISLMILGATMTMAKSTETSTHPPFLNKLATQNVGLMQITNQVGYKIDYLYNPTDQTTLIAFYNGETGRLFKLDQSGKVIGDIETKDVFSLNGNVLFAMDGYIDWHGTLGKKSPYDKTINRDLKMTAPEVIATFKQLYEEASIVDYSTFNIMGEDGIYINYNASFFKNKSGWTVFFCQNVLARKKNDLISTQAPLVDLAIEYALPNHAHDYDFKNYSVYLRKPAIAFVHFVPQVLNSMQFQSPSKMNGIELKVKSLKTKYRRQAGHPGIPLILNYVRIGPAVVQLITKPKAQAMQFTIPSASQWQWSLSYNLDLQIYHLPLTTGTVAPFAILESKESSNIDREGLGIYILKLN